MDNIDWCINYLIKYNHLDLSLDISKDKLLRALMNITMPYDLSEEFYKKQDYAIKQIYQEKNIINIDDIPFIKKRLCLYKGDITLIKADAIVNACNEKLLGCFQPLHNCIDNAIHSFAGLQVRRDLIKIMSKQKYFEHNGQCKVTRAYNLPARFIFHTVGPKVMGQITFENETDLKNCYLSCLKKADEMNLTSIVFPCISTGIYGYPKKSAALLAYNTLQKYIQENKNSTLKKIVLNVFTEEDYETYKRIITNFD